MLEKKENFHKEEGSVFLGTTNILPQKETDRKQNDIIITDSENQENNVPGVHFMIKYCFYNRAYILRYLGLGLGPYHKLVDSEVLEYSIILHFGKSYFLITIFGSINLSNNISKQSSHYGCLVDNNKINSKEK